MSRYMENYDDEGEILFGLRKGWQNVWNPIETSSFYANNLALSFFLFIFAFK